VSLSCWMSGTGMAIPIRCKVREGPVGILLYPIGGNLSSYEMGLRVFCCTQQGKTYGKARHMI
jgi:hypothetical protein